MSIEKRGDWWFPSRDTEYLKVAADMRSLHLAMARVQARNVAVQAGGCIGVWPRQLSAWFRAVYTFEPDPENFECLVKNLSGLTNVAKMQACLGAGWGPVGMQVSDANAGAGFVYGEGGIPDLRIDDLRLDACNLICLDVEGYELPALMGARETLRKFRPVVLCEEKGLGERYKFGNVAEWLTEHGYKEVGREARDVVFAWI